MQPRPISHSFFRWRAATAGAFGLVLLATLFMPPLIDTVAATTANEREQNAAKLEILRARIRDLHTALDQARGHKDSVQEELRIVEETIGQLASRLRTLDSELERHERRLRELNDQRKTLLKLLDEQRKTLAHQARAAYATGRQEYLKMLLNQEDPAKVGRMLGYYHYFMRARVARITEIKETLLQLDQVEASIREQRDILEQLRVEQLNRQQDLEERRHARLELLAKLDSEIASKDKALKQMQQDEDDLERVIQALREALADIPKEVDNRQPFARLKGRLRWPISGRILVSYGAFKGSKRLKWNGVLISAREGREVQAISYGRVAFADWLRGFGLLIIVDHGGGYMSLYGHNQSLYKETGDWVEAGEVLSSVGNSGGRVEPALYFEIRHNGMPYNPRLWCKAQN